MIELRPYQSEAVRSIYNYFEKNDGNPLIVIPTAGGKSLILADFIKSACTTYLGTRVLVLTHVKELIAQDHAEILSWWPEAPVGIYSAGLRKRELHAQVLIAGIQSIHNKAYHVQHVDLVIIDEAHLIPRTSNTMYRRFLDELRQINPHIKIIGFTATPFRLDSGMLLQGDDALFTDIAFDASVNHLISNKYLCRPVSITTKAQIDIKGVHTRGGEFVAGELEKAAMKRGLSQAIAAEIVSHGAGRIGWLVFGSGVEHSRELAWELKALGVSVKTIFGDTPPDERSATIESFKRKEIQCLCAMNVLTTGFNARHVDLIAVARPTKSTGLWIQIVGRGMRLFDGKDDCLVLDFGGNIKRHGPIDNPNVKVASEGDGDNQSDDPDATPVKICPNCKARVHISAMECPECGEEFEIKETLSRKAQGGAMLSVDLPPAPEPEWVKVTRVSYARHQKPGSPPSMKVTYQCGMSTHREWICFEHTGYPRQKADQWWKKRLPVERDEDWNVKYGAVPLTVDEALRVAHHLLTPDEIRVKLDGKFTRIIGECF